MLDRSPKLSTTIDALLPKELMQENFKYPYSNTEVGNFYRCLNCNNVISGPNAKSLFEQHIKTCVDVKCYDCSICYKKFFNKRGLNTHLRNIHLVFD